jgi:replicative DNA helicase
MIDAFAQAYGGNGGQNRKPNYASNRNLDRNNGGDLSALVFGKVQPQALQLEEAVLGALMLDKDAMPTVLDLLRPDSFYSEAHQYIYKAILELFRTSKPIDLLTVTEELRRMGAIEAIGGAYYLVELTNRVGSAANIEYHARIIAQKHIQRELIKVSTSIIRDAYEDTTDVFDLLDKAEQNLFGITETNLTRSFEAMSTLSSKLLKQIESLSNKGDGLTGIPTGFTDFDRLTSGLQPSDLIIVAARPAMGKTACTLSLARNAAMDFGKPVAFFSLEMSNLQLVQRLISMEAEISSSKLRAGQLDSHEWQQLHAAIERMSKAPIYIDDTPGINVFELRAKCRRLKAQHDIQLIVIDYLQLMSGHSDNRNGNREQEISGISRALKSLAKELQVPVIALSQLSRAVETRGGSKKPQLSDLRESGAIEQDADIVCFLYRPEYYQIMEDENGNSTKGIAQILVSKHRNGSLGEISMRFLGEFSRFVDADNFTFGTGQNRPKDENGNPIFDTPHNYLVHQNGGGSPQHQGNGEMLTLPSSMNDVHSNVITRPSKMNEDGNIPF